MSMVFYMDDGGTFRAYCLSCNEITAWSQSAPDNDEWHCECGSREADNQATQAYINKLAAEAHTFALMQLKLEDDAEHGRTIRYPKTKE